MKEKIETVGIEIVGIDEFNKKLEHAKELLEQILKLYEKVQSEICSINCIDIGIRKASQ